MEEIVALFVQFVLEVGLQLFGSIGFDYATELRRSRDPKGEVAEGDGCGWLFAFAVFGGICGGVSLIFAPKLMLPNLGLRLANLVVSPLVAGGLSYLVARHVWAARGPARGTTSGAASGSRWPSAWSASPTPPACNAAVSGRARGVVRAASGC